MINRRFGLFAVIALLTLTELGYSGTAVAQLREGHFRIGVLVFSSFRGPLWSAFVEELRKLGYIEGQNTALEVRTAESQQERLPALASELVALNPEVIFTSTAPAIMALKEIGTFIPVVFAGLGDVVLLGVVESIRHPGANFTGITNNSDELQAKRLQLLKELVPDVVRVATFQNPLNASSVQMLGALEKVSNSLGTEIIPIEIKRGEDLPEAIDGAVRAGAQALISTPDPITYVHRSTIIELSRQKHLPTMYPNPVEAKDGGLIAFGADGEAQWRRAAVYVDKILRGAKPADLPVEQATPILAINRKTAEALGIKIPPTLLGRADEVIE